MLTRLAAVAALALLTTHAAAPRTPLALAPSRPRVLASSRGVDAVSSLHGEWIFVEDLTQDRPVESQQPSMSAKVALRLEDGALVLVRRDGEIRMALDGTPTEVPRRTADSHSRYHGTWKDGAFTYDVDMFRGSDDTPTGLIRTELRPTPQGLVASVAVDPPDGFSSVALYRHAADIEMPAMVEAKIDGMAWLAGPWVGTRGSAGTTSIEERWSPPLGGAMLATSRTASRDAMVAFEHLRIVERDGGLVYVAQPNGIAPTEFLLTELSERRAVFENPRHDFPQCITYELSEAGALTASIGYAKGQAAEIRVRARERVGALSPRVRSMRESPRRLPACGVGSSECSTARRELR
ncbi:MAG: DUF6265 family protein [Planctomycetota bacterium]